MRALAATVLLLLAGSASAKSADEPTYDCSIEVSNGQDRWSADRYGVTWVRYTNDRHFILASLGLYSLADRVALQRHGVFNPALLTNVSFGPPTAKARKPLWLALESGEAKLNLRQVSKDKGFYGAASVSLFELEPLLEASPQLQIDYVLPDGSRPFRSSILTSELRAAVERFPALAREYEARAANPDGVCKDLRHDNEIIVV